MESVYIHIPFCNSICSYCDFCKVLYNRKWTIPYLDALKKEIEDNYSEEELLSIYIGGGTPSSLSAHELNYLFSFVNGLKKKKEYEFTFECNVADINDNLLELLQKNGVNRLSIGIESFEPNILNEMDRPYYSLLQVKVLIELCHKYGFNNINVDLMYGFKNQKFNDVKEDLKKIIDLKVQHISTYSLLINPNTYLGCQNYVRMDDDKDAKIYEYIRKKLVAKGYEHYEVSNFSIHGFNSKHNLKYWNNEEYYGFGLGACGYVEGLRYENTKSLTSYLNGVTKLESNILSKKEIMENEIMLGLRKIKGINLQKFYDKYKVNLQEVFDIKELLKRKDIVYKKGYLFIPKEKIYIMNEILIKIL